MADSRLNIIIEAQNKAKAGLSSVAGDLDNLKSAAQGNALSFSTLSKAGIALGAVLSAIQIGETAFALGKAAAQADRLSVAFGSLSAQVGQNATAMLSAMRKASDGTISDVELIAGANRALLLEVADTAEEMTGLMDVAIARGKAMGLSSAQAFSDLVTGIGRMSPLILDNLGIVTDADRTFKAYAETLGKSSDELTNTERKQALLNRVLEESESIVQANAAGGRDMASSFERMDASIQNAKQALGELFSPAVAVIADNLATATARMLDAMKDAEKIDAERGLFSIGDSIAGVAEELGRQIEAMQNAAIGGDGAALKAAAQQVEMLRISINALGQEYNTTAQITGAPLLDLALLANGTIAFQDLSEAQAQAAAAAARNEAAMLQQAGQAYLLTSRIQELTGRLREIAGVSDAASSALKSSFLGIADVIGGATALDGYRKANQQLQDQIAIYTKLDFSAEEIEFKTQGFVESVRDANSELEKTLTSTDGIKASISAFDSLKDKVAGVLSGALSSGINLDDILPRQDAIEEDARRLADVAVNGYASPWASYLQDKFPQLFAGKSGDIKGIAAGLLRDFEDGLRPELLDRERAKDRVRRMLLGEANISQLAQDIAGELAAEFGGQFSQADILSRAQSALGAGGAISSGATSVNGGQIASNALGSIEAGFADDKAITKAKNIGANFMRTLFEGAFDTADTFPFWDKLLAIIIQQRVAAAGAN